MRIRVGLVGTGFAVSTQLAGFRQQGDIEVVAICSGQPERAEAAAREYNIPLAYPSFERMLSDAELDLVSVAAPPSLHRELTIAAVRVGKHVLCEKPAGLNAAEAREMLAEADRAGVVHLVDYLFRWDPARARMKELIEEGYLGRLYSVQVSAVHSTWADPHAELRSWLYDRASGGGALAVRGSHLIDVLHYWFGEISAVAARIDVFVEERSVGAELQKVEMDDGLAAILEFAGGGWATIHLNASARHGPGTQFDAYGSDGTLVITADGRLLGGRRDEPRLAELEIPERLRRFPGRGLVPAFALVADTLVRAIREGAPAQPSLSDALQVHEVMEALQQSQESRCWITLPQPHQGLAGVDN